MLDFKKQYKQPPSTFGNTKKIKSDLSHEQRERRKKRRIKDFEEKRKDKSHFLTISQKNETDKMKLLKWKMEQETKKKEQKLQKKLPFIVGTVHHSFYSPIKTTKNSSAIIKKRIVQTQKKFNNTKQAEITRAREKKLLIDFPAVPFKTPLFEEVLSSNEFPTKDAIIEKFDILMKEKEHIIKDFKHLLCKENDRLQKCCKHWTEIQSRNDITEDIRCCINQAVGQTTLLINKKFRQFYGLILLCEKGNTDVSITCTDLHGFWDMMYIEIKDCDSRFEKLEELCARCWKKKQLSFINSAKKKTNAKEQDISVKQNSLQALISSDNKKRKTTKMQDNKKALEQILFTPISDKINMNNEFVHTPISDKGTLETIEENCNVSHHKCRKNLLKIYTKSMVTSTPLTSSNLNMSASLITMKISQLYNKSTMYDHTCILSEQTLKKHITEKSGKSK